MTCCVSVSATPTTETCILPPTTRRLRSETFLPVYTEHSLFVTIVAFLDPMQDT